MTMENSAPQSLGRVLSIAGLDPSGGAGLLADIKTISALGGYACGITTALTVQNTLGVSSVEPVDATLVTAQIKAVLDDMDIAAIKVGMLANDKIIAVVCDQLIAHPDKYIMVVDPVFKSSSGATLLNENGVEILSKRLLPLTTLLTPNIAEAEVLSGMAVKTKDHMLDAAKKLMDMGAKNVLVTGGHLSGNEAIDVLLTPQGSHIFSCEMLDASNTHGTGCALSSAIATLLAQGKSMLEAVEGGKNYVYEAIKTAPNIGQGNGPINHMVKL